MLFVFGFGRTLLHFAIGEESSSNILDIIRTSQMNAVFGPLLYIYRRQSFCKTKYPSPEQIIVIAKFRSYKSRM